MSITCKGKKNFFSHILHHILYTVGVDFYKQTSCVKLFFSNILQHILPSLTLILYLIFPWHLMLQKLG